MHLSDGKRKGLAAIANNRGQIAALAIDQRSALRGLFAAATGTPADQVPRELLKSYKTAVSRVLTPHASAILLDPELGLEAAGQRAKTAGLLLAYEQTGYDQSVYGRLPRLLDGWTARRLVGEGANGIKTLLYYSPFSSPAINQLKHSWVQRVGAECIAEDVPYFLELVAYHDEIGEKSRDFARVKPEIVTRSIAEFSQPQYGVDVLKVGVPVVMAFVAGFGKSGVDSLYTREEAKTHFRQASDVARKPFIYLSEGVSNEVFSETLELAAEAGSNFSGVLCGRATWKDGVPIFATQGLQALEDWLSSQGVRNIERVNERLKNAVPYLRFYETVDSSRTVS
jgi:tagatose 1,6-diphosphate aldolase